MKLVPALSALDAWIVSTIAIYADAAYRWSAEQYHAVRSFYAGTVHLIEKLWLRDPSLIISKFRQSIADESMAATLVRHFGVVRTLNRCGAAALTRSFPNYANKYAANYLAKSFGKRARRDILKFHHSFLSQRVTGGFYAEILQGGQNLWQETIGDNRYTMSLSFNAHFHSEGDLSLVFAKNDAALYELSFSIVPGKVIGSAAEQVLLVGRVQGRIGQAEDIKVSTKAFRDVAPPHLLLAAALSIADVLSIRMIAGVGNDEQLAKSSDEVSTCYFDYDAFWETFFFDKNAANIYGSAIPLHEKPIEQFRRDHRRRARLKRGIKKQIGEHVGASFAQAYMGESLARRPARGAASKIKARVLGVATIAIAHQLLDVSDLIAFS